MVLQGYLDDRSRTIVRLRVRGATGAWTVLSCEIDTGAEPMLLTSRAWLEDIGGLIDDEPGEVITLADGSQAAATYATFEVEWFEQPRLIDVLIPHVASVAEGFLPPRQRGRRTNALLGRGMLTNTRLTIDYGRASVTIALSEPMPA